MSRAQWTRVLLFGVVLVAAATRFAGLGWGVPDALHRYSYHPDEFFVVYPSVTIAGGDWNPHFFNYGTLYIYLAAVAAKALTLFGFSPFATDSLGPLHLVARSVTALLGIGAVWLTYLIGREMSGRAAGLIAAALLTICPLHLVNSHYATVDVPATFFVVLAAWASVRLMRRDQDRWYALAGLAVGLAAATKYTMAAAVIFPVAAHLLAPAGSPADAFRHARLLLALALIPAGFLIGCPYALQLSGGIQLRPEFLRGALFELRHIRQGGTFAFVESGSGWAYHALHGLPAGLGYPLLALALVAVVCAIVRPRPASAVLVIWTLAYFLLIGFARERFIRYLVPLTPFLMLLIGDLMARAREAPARRWPVAATALLLVGGLTAVYDGGQLARLVGPDPRDLAAPYAIGVTRPGGSVAVPDLPWYFTAPITPYDGGQLSRSAFEAWRATAPYEVVVTGWQSASLRAARPDTALVTDLEYLDAVRLGRPEVREYLGALEREFDRRTVFDNDRRSDWLGPAKAKAPPDWLYPWPGVTVYWKG